MNRLTVKVKSDDSGRHVWLIPTGLIREVEVMLEKQLL